jgi:hypothetical protein
MRPFTGWLSLVSACGAALLLAGVAPRALAAQQTRVYGMTGCAAHG